MRKLGCLAAGLLLAAVTPVAAQDGGGDQARVGNLEVQQLWSADEQGFIKEWSQPKIPDLETTHQTERNRTITMFIVLRGCMADLDGNCRVTGKLEMLDPNGAPYGSVSDGIPVWPSQPAPDASLLVLSPASIRLTIEDGEKLGVYHSRLWVTDEVAKVTAMTDVTIDVSEAAPKG